jgi:hypothetical protein
MAQSLGVQELQGTGRARPHVGLGPVMTLVAVTLAALALAPLIWNGNTPAVRPAPNPVPRVAAATPDWQIAAKKAGFTGQLGAVTPPANWAFGGSWVPSAEAAGYTGKLGGATTQAASAGTGQWAAAAKAAGFTGRAGGATTPAANAASPSLTEKLRAGRA